MKTNTDLKSMGGVSAAAIEASGLNVYYSSAVEGELAHLLGATHYSYRFAESKFVSHLRSVGVDARKLVMPEFYNSANALPSSSHRTDLPSVHLIFRSTEQIRLLKFSWNICCFAWEFDVLKDTTGIDEHPFLNQKRMLTLCSEIWVPCTYTQRVLDRHGVGRVHVIPAPISAPPQEKPSIFDVLPTLGHLFVAPLYFNFLKPRLENRSACAEKASSFIEYMARRLNDCPRLRIYLTILNPEDFRKNLDAMLRGFYYFSSQRTDVVLLVKVLTSASRFHLLDVLSDVIPKKLAGGTAIQSDNIVFFNEYLSDRDMDYLYWVADFYLCSSLCEGQNLPLMEAMAHGVVPVTTANTAMADYINVQNSVLIKDRLESNDCLHLAGTIAGKPFSVNRSSAADVCDALQRSAAITPRRFASMSNNARRTIDENYSRERVAKLINGRFSEIRRSRIVRTEAGG